MLGERDYKYNERRVFGPESRRRSDCFPNGGAVCITIGLASLLAFAFALGVAIGAWWF